MVYSYARGHKIYFFNNAWRYEDNNEPVEGNERPCIRCGKMPTPEGYDACLGFVSGVASACCGHGNVIKTEEIWRYYTPTNKKL